MATEVKPATPGVADSESVCVAVHVRPLIDLEHEQGCMECLEVTPGQPQVRYSPIVTCQLQLTRQRSPPPRLLSFNLQLKLIHSSLQQYRSVAVLIDSPMITSLEEISGRNLKLCTIDASLPSSTAFSKDIMQLYVPHF
jgi:hypothetical protein